LVKKKGLGKGLGALLTDENSSIDSDSITEIKIIDIEPNPGQPRKAFDDEELEELSASIKEHGVITPILVHESDNGYYRIIAGERRWRASKLAGLKKVPVIVKKYSERQIKEISLIENLQREDLNPIEEAQAYKRLMSEFNLKQDEIAERVSKSRTAVTNSMRLLKLCDEVQQMIINDMISTGHARAIISIENPEEQYALAQKIFDEKLSVRDVEKYIKNMNKPVKEKKKINKSLEVIYQEKEEVLKQALSTKVSVSGKGDGTGKIEIEFFSHDDFDRLMEILTKNN